MAFLNPSRVLNEIKIEKKYVAADFGSGSGGWAIPLAQKVEEGKVYAIDILEEPLSALKSKLKLRKISNIETVKSDVERNSKLLSNSCDLILMTNLLFEAEDKKKTLEEGKRVLKERGKILVVDWKKDVSLGPEKKISSQEIKEIAQDIGLRVEKEFEAGVYHWALLLVK